MAVIIEEMDATVMSEPSSGHAAGESEKSQPSTPAAGSQSSGSDTRHTTRRQLRLRAD